MLRPLPPAALAAALACGPQVDDPDGAMEGNAESSGAGGACVRTDIGAPPPGQPGGLCLAPDGHCDPGVACNVDENYCFVQADPCDGFDCGGSMRGCCSAQGGAPVCTCDEGFDNGTFSHYCCPLDGSDPFCPR